MGIANNASPSFNITYDDQTKEISYCQITNPSWIAQNGPLGSASIQCTTEGVMIIMEGAEAEASVSVDFNAKMTLPSIEAISIQTTNLNVSTIPSSTSIPDGFCDLKYNPTTGEFRYILPYIAPVLINKTYIHTFGPADFTTSLDANGTPTILAILPLPADYNQANNPGGLRFHYDWCGQWNMGGVANTNINFMITQGTTTIYERYTDSDLNVIDGGTSFTGMNGVSDGSNVFINPAIPLYYKYAVYGPVTSPMTMYSFGIKL